MRESKALERRYRWLLACYPWEYRRVYEEEMLGVLLAGARPGQRFPALPDVADVLIAAAGQRLAVARAGLAGQRWRDAAAVAGLLLAVLTLAINAAALVANLFASADVSQVGKEDWLAVGCSLTVVVAALVGPWWAAAAAAWASVLAQAGVAFVLFSGAVPNRSLMLLPATVAAAALTAPVPTRRAASLLGRRRLGTVLAVGLLTAPPAAVPVQALAARLLGLRRGMLPPAPIDPVTLACLGTAIGGLLAVTLTLAAPLRRRVLAVLAAPVVPLAVALLYAAGSLPWLINTVPGPAAVRWALVLGCPVPAFLFGVALLGRRERSLRLRQLGMAADRERAMS